MPAPTRLSRKKGRTRFRISLTRSRAHALTRSALLGRGRWAARLLQLVEPRPAETVADLLADLDYFRTSLGEKLYYPRAIAPSERAVTCARDRPSRRPGMRILWPSRRRGAP
ncbi:hypothetical protein BE15_36455 [Sorangium cellulosum]|uniref:Uncharacterized protein n=1 Tax=Sorangium cellulosum TaxID=56 RepID=A0A150QTZ9_SORCE|nr:hypothetical protein BE15_36455 [Sorangium cellulosum]